MNKHFKRILLLVSILCVVTRQGVATTERYALWDSSGHHKVSWHLMDADQKTFALERYKQEIEYCLASLGSRFDEADLQRVGSDKGYAVPRVKGLFPVIGYGLIAFKYLDDSYHFPNAAKYFYKDWLEYKKSIDGQKSVWSEGPGDYHPLGSAIGTWKNAGLYADALKHYQEYFDDRFLRISGNMTRKERVARFQERLQFAPRLKREYEEFMTEWTRTRQLAKTTKPKPLDPAVQNHEWFYSGKQEEVLKSLEYYQKNKVRFMLEIALKHKDPAVAAKAKEYLESLGKDKGEGDGAKK